MYKSYLGSSGYRTLGVVKPIKQFRAIYIKSNIKKNALFIYHHQRFLPKNLPATAFFFTRKDQNKSDFSLRKEGSGIAFFALVIIWNLDYMTHGF